MSKKELISVLMPVYNCEDYILQSVYSVLSSLHSKLELIIYNDGSTDETTKMLSYVKDPRVKVIHSDVNRGVSFARNILLDRAQGEFVALQDADDVSLPNRFVLQIMTLKKENLVFVCTPLRVMGKSDTIYYETDVKEVLKSQYQTKKPLSGATAMFKRRVIDRNIRYDIRLKAGEDLLFEAEVQAMFPLQMCSVNYSDVLYWYRKREGSLTYLRRQKEIKVPQDLMSERNRKIRSILKPLIFTHKLED